ncbi:50S ribosomal protein L9 [Sodalis sp. CWE]|uniref:50S ribosomal protein L9 n=1 Tax=Sodalis sp. CWE TaxID=2803816 RepID=UPI001C7D6074|nr:50S ribosomal protein L9 [Sodalis sp. CWE]MBX4180799.1 50S ribosomal protein L9 [Sodalis sp. CWE]
MQIIMLDTISKLGNFGKQVSVKAGYARNYLIPQGKAILATKKNLELIESRRNELEVRAENIRRTAEERALKLKELGSITIFSKAGSKNRLFGSIGTRDIANAISDKGIKIVKNEVRLKANSLRSVGSHVVKIQVHREISVNINIIILPET